jgi:HPt (histidine-containing phosphotransfer) domain-containing protein
MQLFLDEQPNLLHGVRSAAAAGDFDALQRAAHAVKGTCANLGARPAAEAALALETAARDGDATATGELVEELEAALRVLEDALKASAGDTRG